MEENRIFESVSTRGPLPWNCFVDGRVPDKDGNPVEITYQSQYFGTFPVDKDGRRTLVSLVLSMKGKLIEVYPVSVRLAGPVRFVHRKDGEGIIEIGV